MAALTRHGATRIGGSVLQRTHAAVVSPAVADARRLLVPRRMLTTAAEKLARRKRDEELLEQFKFLKPHQICWELIKRFPGRKVLKAAAVTTAAVTMVSAGIAVKEDEKKQQHLLRLESERRSGSK